MATFWILHPLLYKGPSPSSILPTVLIHNLHLPLFSPALKKLKKSRMSDHEDYCYADDYYSDNDYVDYPEYYKGPEQQNSSPGRDWFRRGEQPLAPPPVMETGKSSAAKPLVEKKAAENPAPMVGKAEPDAKERVGEEVKEEFQTSPDVRGEHKEKIKREEEKEDDLPLPACKKLRKTASC